MMKFSNSFPTKLYFMLSYKIGTVTLRFTLCIRRVFVCAAFSNSMQVSNEVQVYCKRFLIKVLSDSQR